MLRQFVSMRPLTVSISGRTRKQRMPSPMQCIISKALMQSCSEILGVTTFLKKQMRNAR